VVVIRIFGIWQWNDTDVMWATFIIAACMVTAGIACMLRARGNTNTFSLGASLVSGAFVTVAIFGLQLASNLTAKEESFQLGIAMQSDLSGFDPQGRSLEKAHFNSKTLDGAKLRNADLRQASLRNASLRDAQLHGANLEGADLLAADLFVAELPGANLRNADLRSAKLEDANIWTADFRGAKVNDETCWPLSFWQQKVQRAALVPMESHTPTRVVPASLGHPCEPREHLQAGGGSDGG
jgi:pentapeptide repeat protein